MEQIKLNTIPSGVQSVCHISQFDNTSRVIRCHLFNGADPLTLTGSETIRLFMRKSDNSRATFEIANSGGTYVDLVVTTEMSDIAGDSECKFQIINGETTLGSLVFKMKIEPDAYGDSLKTRSVSGPIATFETDLAEDLIKLDADLEPVQDLHGYDNPWPAGGGPNKITVNRTKGTLDGYYPSSVRNFEYNKYYVGLSANNYYQESLIQEYSVGNDQVVMKTNRNSYGIAFPIKTQPNTNYYVGATLTGTAKMQFSWFDADGNHLGYRANISEPIVVTTPENCYTMVLIVYDGSASGTTVGASNVFINLPSTVTEYTPYANICPISGHDSAQLFRTGKNLLNKESYEWISNSNIIFGGTNTTISDSLILSPGTYALSCSHNVAGFYIDNHGGVVKRAYNTNSTTFSISSRQSVRINFYIANVTQSDLLSFDYQLELGSTATDYEPYESDPTPITVQFGQTVYKGKLDSARRKIIVYFTGRAIKTFPWTWYEAEAYPGYFATGNTTDKAYNTNYICECFRSVDKARGFLENGELGVYNLTNGSRRFVIRYDGISTVESLLEQFGDYLICYELETPIEIDLAQVQTASIDSTPVASFETTLAMPLNTSEHSFSCSQAEGTPTPDSPIPITGVSEITAFRTGKNLIDDTTKYAYSGNIVYIGQTDNNYHVFLKAGTYTVSVDFNGVPYGFYYKSANSENVKIWGSGSGITSATFVIPEDGYYRFWVYYNPATGTIDVNNLRKIQLELGSTATEYEPYSGESITVSLGGTYYGGKLVQSEDGSRKIVLDKAFTKINALTWTYVSLYTYFTAYPANLKQNSDAGKKLDGLMCDIYTNRTPQQTGSGDIDLSISGYQDQIRIKNKTYSDITTWLAAVGNHDIVYPLADPIEIDLPDGDPLNAVVGENNVYCNTGDTALTYYFNMVADPIRIPALVGTNNVYSDAGDVDVEYYTTLEGGND